MLEKNPKIINSNLWPITTLSTEPGMAPSATSSQLMNSSRDGDSSTPLGNSFQCLAILSMKEFFLKEDVRKSGAGYQDNMRKSCTNRE